ncbi:hypothetical protein [Phascolarctobacterium succinatutens]|nr:hypothetical protein [Phascolarctobacterium succinatutens]
MMKHYEVVAAGDNVTKEVVEKVFRVLEVKVDDTCELGGLIVSIFQSEV